MNINELSVALNYLQRINYCLKVYYIKKHRDDSPFTIGRIKTLNFEQTVNLYRNVNIDEIFTEEEVEVFNDLKKHNKFVCENCFMEFQYDLNNSIYHKKVDYVNARISYINNTIKMFCYKMESIALGKEEESK